MRQHARLTPWQHGATESFWKLFRTKDWSKTVKIDANKALDLPCLMQAGTGRIVVLWGKNSNLHARELIFPAQHSPRTHNNSWFGQSWPGMCPWCQNVPIYLVLSGFVWEFLNFSFVLRKWAPKKKIQLELCSPGSDTTPFQLWECSKWPQNATGHGYEQ